MSEIVRSRCGVSDRLRAHGYALFDVEMFQDSDDCPWSAGEEYLGSDRARLVDSCRHLPEDASYAAGATYRRRGRFMQLPGRSAPVPFGDNWALETWPAFTQVPDIAPLTEAQRGSFALHRAMLRGCRAATRLGRDAPVEIGVEIFQAEPGRDEPVVALPEPSGTGRASFRMVVLMARAGVEGGEAFITAPQVAGIDPRFLGDSVIRDRFALTRPWQGCIVDAAATALYLSPLRLASGSGDGRQTLLIIDYTRLVPELPR